MKKSLVILLALILALSLAACGGGGEPAPADEPDPAEAQQQEPADTQEPDPEEDPAEEEDPAAEAGGYGATKTGRFYSQYPGGKLYMKYEMNYEGQNMIVTSATDGEKTYAETQVNGESVGETIMDGEYMYTIDHASKMVIKMSLAMGSQQEMVDTVLEESELDMANFRTGTREVDGKVYDTEEWDMGEVTSIMCFDGDQLAYMISEDENGEYIIKVLEVSGDVDSGLFNIPSDYQLLEM